MEQTAYIWTLAIGVVTQAVVLIVFTSSATQIIASMIMCSLTLVLAGEGLFWFTRRKVRAIQVQL
jgi:hypothetical protein